MPSDQISTRSFCTAKSTALDKRWQPNASRVMATDTAGNRIEALNDIHASAEYRLHLARVNTKRALELAVSRI
jgi:CO/xanthine dehydrogenase FAD-binding subunit